MEDVEYPNNAINWSPLWCLMSLGGFYVTKQMIGSQIPVSVSSQGPKTVWKWVNIVNSLIHSLITGLGALICFYLYPQTAADVVSSYSKFAHVLVAFSVGYFVFDFFDMFINHRKRSSYELMVHHGFVISCFTLAMLTQRYLGFGIVSLTVEVNSVFLHWRQILLLQSVTKTDYYYRTVSLLNLFTFVIFRIVTLCWMTRWLALNRDKVNFPVYTLGCTAMAVLVSMSIVLFLRLLRADFRSKGKEEKEKSQ